MTRETMGVPVPRKADEPTWLDRNRALLIQLAQFAGLIVTAIGAWLGAADASKAKKQSEGNAKHLEYVKEKADANHAAVEDIKRNAKVIMYGQPPEKAPKD
jgi:hypothetical protein